MDLERIIADLKQEGNRLSRAIAELERTNLSRPVRKTIVAAPHSPATTGDKRGKGLTPEGRRRLSLAMKRRWAERKKKES